MKVTRRQLKKIIKESLEELSPVLQDEITRAKFRGVSRNDVNSVLARGGDDDRLALEISILRRTLRELLTESVSPEDLQLLAAKIMATDNVSLIGDIGEAIALLYHPNGMNLNSVKKNTFPFADIASGQLPTADFSKRTYKQKQRSDHPFPPFYSVKASGSITYKKRTSDGVWQGADPFVNSKPHAATIKQLVNGRGKNGIRDEIDAVYGPAEPGKVVKLKLGAIGISARAKTTSEDGEQLLGDVEPTAVGVTVKKYGPKEFEFIANDEGKYVNSITGKGLLGSESLIVRAFGASKILTKVEGTDPESVVLAATSGRKDQKADSVKIADKEIVGSLRKSIAAIDDSRIDRSSQDLKTIADIIKFEDEDFQKVRELVKSILSQSEEPR